MSASRPPGHVPRDTRSRARPPEDPVPTDILDPRPAPSLAPSPLAPPPPARSRAWPARPHAPVPSDITPGRPRLAPSPPARRPLRDALTLALALTACEELPRTYSTQAATLTPLYRDDFAGPELAAAWKPTGEGARIEDGALVVEGLRNHPVWLTLELPDDVRIEFDAWAESEEGDIKVELAGDGVSVARAANYVASGYVIVFGGWNNELSAIARRSEHGKDRLTATEPKVEPGRRYHFTLLRQAGTLRWEIDGAEILTFEDDAPLVGPGHRHFAFSGWESRVRFDNLVIYAL